MNLRLFGTLLIILAGTNTVWSSPNNKLLVKAGVPECQDKGEVLFCDYKSGNQIPVYLEKLDNLDVTKVFIYSALDVHVSDDACVDVVIHNAKGATVSKSSTKECKRKTALSATKSEFKTIETRLGTIKLDDCRVDKLILDSELFELDIKKTEIGVLDVSGQTESGAKATIQDAKINTLERLFIYHGSKWDIQRSQISKLKLQGLEIVDGTLTITDSSVQNTAEDSSLFENFHGSITLKGFPNQGSRNDRNTKCYIFIGLFCLFLILLILSWICFTIYLNKNRISKTPSLLLSAIRGASSKSKIQSKDERENMHPSIDSIYLDTKVNYTNEQAETKILLPEIEDKTEPKACNQQQTQGIKSNISIQKMNEHLQQLKEYLIALKTRFEESENTFQKHRKAFSIPTEEQRKQDSSGTHEKLKYLCTVVQEQFEKLVALSKVENEILIMSIATKALGNRTSPLYFHEFFKNSEHVFKKNSCTDSDIQKTTDLVNKLDTELTTKLNKVLIPKKKSELEKLVKQYEQDMKYTKGYKYYCIPQDILDSVLNIVSDMEMACLNQNSMLILESFMQAEKVHLLTLYINIALTKILLGDPERHNYSQFL